MGSMFSCFPIKLKLDLDGGEVTRVLVQLGDCNTNRWDEPNGDSKPVLATSGRADAVPVPTFSYWS